MWLSSLTCAIWTPIDQQSLLAVSRAYQMDSTRKCEENGYSNRLNQESTNYSIKCVLLILFILLTSVLLLFLLAPINEREMTISEKEAVIVSHDIDINQLKHKINELTPEHTSVMLLGGKHYFITNSITIYDSMEKSWKYFKLTLPRRLAKHGAAILNNEIYIFGGNDGRTSEPLNYLYKLGAGNKWERMADMNEKRSLIAQSSVVFNSEIWVIGGFNRRDFLKSVEKYNPKTDKWTKMPELNESKGWAAATVVDGKIYVSGGMGSTGSMEVYDPEKGKWEIFTPSIPYKVDSHILIGNHSHLITIDRDVSYQKRTNRVWRIDVLDPKREWKNEAPLPGERGVFASIPLTWTQERLFLKRFCQNS